MLYLGHIISGDGIAVGPEKLAKVADWPTPKTKVDIQRFLGLTNYFRKFIPRYAEMVAPLTDLTKKARMWIGPLNAKRHGRKSNRHWLRHRY